MRYKKFVYLVQKPVVNQWFDTGLKSWLSSQDITSVPLLPSSCSWSLAFSLLWKRKEMCKIVVKNLVRDLQATHRDCYTADRNQRGRVSRLIKQMWPFEKLQGTVWTMEWSQMKKKKARVVWKTWKGLTCFIIQKQSERQFQLGLSWVENLWKLEPWTSWSHSLKKNIRSY